MSSSESTKAHRPLELPPSSGDARTDAVRRLAIIVDRLRDPDGCPWDRAQTMESLAPHLVEEAHELCEAIECGSDAEIAEEAGDLLMGIALVARTAAESGRFDLASVADKVSDKLIRRHPHVFGGAEARTAEEALGNWEAVKRGERAAKSTDASALAGIPRALPALQRAKRMGEKAIAAGFRWSGPEGARAKLEEEVAELVQALAAADSIAATAGSGANSAAGPAAGSTAGFAASTTGPEPVGAGGALNEPEGAGPSRPGPPGRPGPASPRTDEVERELGDVLLAAAFLGCYLQIDPERAARRAARRFEQRFRHMETELEGRIAERPLALLLEAWERAKESVDAAAGGASSATAKYTVGESEGQRWQRS